MKQLKIWSTLVVSAICGCIGAHSKYCENAEAYHTEIRTTGETQQAMPKVLSAPSNVVVTSSTAIATDAIDGGPIFTKTL